MPVEGDIKIFHPFDSHPRVVIDDYEMCAEIIKYVVFKLKGFSFLGPRVVVHLDKALAGGPAQVEHKALIEMAENAGARHAYLLTQEGVAKSDLNQEDLEASLKKSFP